MTELVPIFFLLFALIFFLNYQANKITKDIEKNKGKQECPPHKWAYIKQPGMNLEYLQCTKCKMFPGGKYGEDV